MIQESFCHDPEPILTDLLSHGWHAQIEMCRQGLSFCLITCGDLCSVLTCTWCVIHHGSRTLSGAQKSTWEAWYMSCVQRWELQGRWWQQVGCRGRSSNRARVPEANTDGAWHRVREQPCWLQRNGNRWQSPSSEKEQFEKLTLRVLMKWKNWKAQEMRIDEFSRNELRESQATIHELTSQMQELQERINYMNDSREFQDIESTYGNYPTFPVVSKSAPNHGSSSSSSLFLVASSLLLRSDSLHVSLFHLPFIFPLLLVLWSGLLPCGQRQGK